VLGFGFGAMDKIKSKQIWQLLGYPLLTYEIAVKSSFDAGSCKAKWINWGIEVMVKPAQKVSSNRNDSK